MSQSKKDARRDFRDAVFKRDKNACRTCGATNVRLDAHHITDRKSIANGGYVAANGIALCDACHIKAEAWHISGNTKAEPGFHPDDLYRLIGSNYEAAVRAAKKLGATND